MTWEESEGNLSLCVLKHFLMSNVSLVTGGMGDDSLIIKQRSYPVERLKHQSCCFSKNHILWIYQRWLVKDNEKGLNWSGPSLENHILFTWNAPPKLYLLSITHMQAQKVRFGASGLNEDQQMQSSQIHVGLNLDPWEVFKVVTNNSECAILHMQQLKSIVTDRISRCFKGQTTNLEPRAKT